jgi:hypothetical protein
MRQLVMRQPKISRGLALRTSLGAAILAATGSDVNVSGSGTGALITRGSGSGL